MDDDERERAALRLIDNWHALWSKSRKRQGIVSPPLPWWSRLWRWLVRPFRRRSRFEEFTDVMRAEAPAWARSPEDILRDAEKDVERMKERRRTMDAPSERLL